LEQPITFSRADYWVHILDLSSYPLVVEPIVEGALLAQTLIDGGSGLNVIFVDTLKKMDFDFKRLTECDKPFFGIVPGKATYPMGRVSLPARRRTSALNISASGRRLQVVLPRHPRSPHASQVHGHPALHLPSAEDVGSQLSPHSLR
jgi:hypothetical protein